MSIEIQDSTLVELINPTIEVEKLADGFLFTEGPVWDHKKHVLYFSDIPSNTIYRFRYESGVDVYRMPSNNSNGLIIDQEGRLIACEHHTRRVTRETARGIEVVVDEYKGKRFNSPNDVIETKDGSLIFSDPPYGLMEGLGGPAEAELSFNGVYCVPAGSTEAILLVDDFETPNGLALSADEKILYVDDTERGHIRRFDVVEDWTVTGGKVFAEIKSKEEDGPDGLKLDVLGNIFCTGPDGIWIFSPEGILLGRILIPEIVANLNWGGKDLSTLFITASTSLFALQCRTHG